MYMIRSSIQAGFIVGFLIAFIHIFYTTPLILEAEKFETASWYGDVQILLVHGDAEHGHDSVLMRYGLSIITSMIVYSALALIMSGLMAVRFAQSPSDMEKSYQGIFWGLSGALSFILLPALGLAPELPGSSAADLMDRQIWWFATIIATITGLWLSVFYRHNTVLCALGILILIAPHAVGAPHVSVFESKVASEIGALFAARTIVISTLGWLALGAFTFHFMVKYKK